MEIKVSREEVRIKAENINGETVNHIVSLLKEIKDLDILYQATTQPVTVSMIPPKIVAEPSPELGTRTRLPNNYDDGGQIKTEKPNVIDLGSLRNAKQSRAEYFRCPKCRQSVVAKVSDHVVMRDLGKKDALHLIDPAALDSIHTLGHFDYKSAEEMITDFGISLIGDGELEAHCPMCKGHDLIEKWIHAFENPLQYGEFENPCPICGSETATVFAVNPSNVNERTTITQCENKECGYILKEGV